MHGNPKVLGGYLRKRRVYHHVGCLGLMHLTNTSCCEHVTNCQCLHNSLGGKGCCALPWISGWDFCFATRRPPSQPQPWRLSPANAHLGRLFQEALATVSCLCLACPVSAFWRQQSLFPSSSWPWRRLLGLPAPTRAPAWRSALLGPAGAPGSGAPTACGVH